jgi:integrase/recombinase XerD
MRKQYNFTSSWVKEKLQHYIAKMKEQKQHPDTIRRNRNYAGLLLEWTEAKQKDLHKITYNDLLSFIQYCQDKHIPPRQINIILLVLRHYFKTLKVSNNPAVGLILKGAHKRVPHDLLSKNEMDELYEKYLITDTRTQRNKVILGLLIYQAVTTQELHKLEPNHVRLKEGKVYIPGGLKSNGRTLNLEAAQMIELQEYLQHTRPTIMKEFTAYRPGRKAEKINDSVYHKMFMSMSGAQDIKPSLQHLMIALRKINPRVKDAGQIRMSVISEWMKEKDLRVVQYMAGHKQVKSTEHYKSVNLEELEEALNQFHPLK